MDETTWEKIDDRFQRWPQDRATSVDASEFEIAMAEFEPNIDTNYRRFVLLYGGGFVGPNPIYGLRRTATMGAIGGMSTAPEITRWFRNKHWPGTEEWLIFSIDQGGNPVGLAKDRTVWLSDQTDFRQIVRIASNFEDYLLKWCLKLRRVE
jgi:hypothetical protein